MEKEVQLKLSLSLVLDRPQNPRPHENFARTVLGSLALFPCHLSKEVNIKVWNVSSWSSLDPENFNNLKVVDIPTITIENPQLIFTPVKYMGGNKKFLTTFPAHCYPQILSSFLFLGYGQEYGEIIVELTNHLKDKFLNVLYVEVLPWYIRPYLHSLRMEVDHNGNKLRVPAGSHIFVDTYFV